MEASTICSSSDDTILDEELDDNEYNLANENDDNEDVLLAESEFDFIDKPTSPSKSHPLSPQVCEMEQSYLFHGLGNL